MVAAAGTAKAFDLAVLGWRMTSKPSEQRRASRAAPKPPASSNRNHEEGAGSLGAIGVH